MDGWTDGLLCGWMAAMHLGKEEKQRGKALEAGITGGRGFSGAHWFLATFAGMEARLRVFGLPFGAPFVDRVGAPGRAQINIHDHWLRMLISEGLPTTLGGILVDRVGADGRMDGWRPAWIDG